MDDYTSNDVEILLLAACKLIEFSLILEQELKKNENKSRRRRIHRVPAAYFRERAPVTVWASATGARRPREANLPRAPFVCL